MVTTKVSPHSDELGAVAGVQFHHGPVDVGADGVGAEAEPGGDLVVAVALGGQGPHLSFPRGELGEAAGRRQLAAGVGVARKRVMSARVAWDSRESPVRQSSGSYLTDPETQTPGSGTQQDHLQQSCRAPQARHSGPEMSYPMM